MQKPNLHFAVTAMVIAGLLACAFRTQAVVYEQWVIHQPGITHWEDETRGIAADSSGNVYVLGWSDFPTTAIDYVIIKYAPDGRRLWLARYNDPYDYSDYASDFVVDAAGNVYVTGHSLDDYVTVKLNPQGQQQWVATYNGPADGYDNPEAIALDGSGNVYVTGASDGTGTFVDCMDYATVKYNPQGIRQWVARYDGLGHDSDYSVDLAVDASGNVYVTGRSDANPASAINWVYATVKYDSMGAQQWVNTYDGSVGGWDRPCALVLDDQSNVYVTGSSAEVNGWNSPRDYATIKYDSQGVQQWVMRHDCPEEDSHEDPSGLGIDTEGNIIITGSVELTAPPTWECLTLKYNSLGILSWENRYSYPMSYSTRAWALTIDASRNIYATGQVASPTTEGTDCIMLRYDPQGNIEWVAVYDLTSSDKECGRYINLDWDGNVLVAGDFEYQIQADTDFLTLKYLQIEGSVLVGMVPMVSPIQIPASGGSFSYHLMAINNVADSLAVDLWWRVVFPGPDPSVSNIGPVYVVLPLDSSATIRTQNVPASAPAGEYQYILNAGDYPGVIWASDTLDVVKLATESGPIISDWANTDERLPEISQNQIPSPKSQILISPNPFNPATVVSYQLPVASFVSLKFYDISGRMVAELVNGWRDAGMYEVTFDGSDLVSGLYLCRIEAGDYTVVKKMVLLK